jgi:hypothetical protein
LWCPAVSTIWWILSRITNDLSHAWALLEIAFALAAAGDAA